ncbi:SDR family oxidoreductase [Desulfocicer niacini]
MINAKPILVTGATGYVAGRLIPLLLADGYKVKAMGRSIPKMADRPWGENENVELVKGDIQNIESLKNATKGCGTVYYLVHSMISQKSKYRDADKTGAKNMVLAAAEEGLEHIIYLGGLGDINHKNISKHLISRNEVGKIFMEGPVPTTVLRAAMILGSGSASFEILRYLAERLPVMVTPKWVSMPTQPISITNVLGYLKGCLEYPETKGKTFDIGGSEVVTYRDLFRIFAKEANLPEPLMIPVPVLTPRLSSLWIHLVTPVPAAIAQPLAEGLSIPTTCTENSISQIISQDLISCSEAIRRALAPLIQEQVDACKADDSKIKHPERSHYGDASYSGGTLFSCGYQAIVKGVPGDLWKSIEKIGGRTGYYGADILWKIRGIIDRFAGGVGLSDRSGSSKVLRLDDTVDFWKVLEIAPESKLLLLSEMKAPGQALLELRIENMDKGKCQIILLSRFLPKGLIGLLYWYSLFPFHQYVFIQMLKGLVTASGLKLVTQPEKYFRSLQI